MKKLYYFLLLAFTLAVRSQIQKSTMVYFSSNEAFMDERQIREIENFFLKYPLGVSSITLTSSTDTIGNLKDNKILCQKRAYSIYKVLKNHYPKVPVHLIIIGESSHHKDLKNNRYCRIGVVFDPFKSNRLPNSYRMKAQKDTLITLNSGIRIKIPPDAFNTSAKDIVLKVQDFVSYTDMIANDMTTMSDGRLLASLGMIDIRAYENNKELELNDEKSLVLMFPKKDSTSGFKLFDADTVNHIVNWTPQNISTADTITKYQYAFYPFSYTTMVGKYRKRTLVKNREKFKDCVIDTIRNGKWLRYLGVPYLRVNRVVLDTNFYVNGMLVNAILLPKFLKQDDSIYQNIEKYYAHYLNNQKLGGKTAIVSLYLDKAGSVKSLKITCAHEDEDILYLAILKAFKSVKKLRPATYNFHNVNCKMDIFLKFHDHKIVNREICISKSVIPKDTLLAHVRRMVKERKMVLNLAPRLFVDSRYEVFNTSRLGLINCDRFLEYDVTDVECTLPREARNPEVGIIYKNMRSYMKYNVVENGKIYLKNVADHQNVILLARYSNPSGEEIIKTMHVNTQMSKIDFNKVNNATEEDLIALFGELNKY